MIVYYIRKTFRIEFKKKEERIDKKKFPGECEEVPKMKYLMY